MAHGRDERGEARPALPGEGSEARTTGGSAPLRAETGGGVRVGTTPIDRDRCPAAARLGPRRSRGAGSRGARAGPGGVRLGGGRDGERNAGRPLAGTAGVHPRGGGS